MQSKKRSRVEVAGSQSQSRDLADAESLEEEEQRPVNRKAARGFIASQACALCRTKKTKCDEGKPCSLCSSLGVDCIYHEKNPTRKEASLSTVMSSLRRLESKLDRMGSEMTISQSQITPAAVTCKDCVTREEIDPCLISSPGIIPDKHTPIVSMNNPLDFEEQVEVSKTRSSISFSQHKVLFWPAILNQLPDPVLEMLQGHQPEYAVEIEMDRKPLSMNVMPYPHTAGDSWLMDLPFAVITGLSNAYFDMFNPGSPILDSDAYYDTILSTVVRNGFGYNTESCLVLNVLALGCLALKTYEEGGFPLTRQEDLVSRSFQAPEWLDIIREYHPGMRFFNEARRRVGILVCENSLHSTQFYLLSGLYYTQIVRPTDQWSMTNKACTCLLVLIKRNPEDNADSWHSDMLHRLFWTALMAESVLIQELDLPPSGLHQHESLIPIPKFTPFQPHTLNPIESSDNTFFHFHFLAQVAHRIILTRIRNTIFFFSASEPFPPTALVSELHHQIEQWRAGLPDPIAFTPTSTPPFPRSPAHAFADALLHARYYIAQFHIGRPFIYKALHTPSTLTATELEACRRGLQAGMDWPVVTSIRRTMLSGMPLKFAFCSQFFGQLLMIWGIKNSPDQKIRGVLPKGHERWCAEMVGLLEDCGGLCFTVARDLEILRGLGYLLKG